ncbi:MAG TPA: hypothetical protein VKA57_17000 [Solirubrobacteraceae bacterium]|nr:hypothetical protein [Solirubrobacteraceae bacterium]
MPRFRSTTRDLPAGPPPEVLLQIDVAWERARELFDSDLELHFEVDATIGRVWAELRCSDGSLVERLSASEALALACGDAAPQLAIAA